MMLWEFPSIAGYGSGMATAAACTIATAQVPSLAMGPSNDVGVTKKKKKWCYDVQLLYLSTFVLCTYTFVYVLLNKKSVCAAWVHWKEGKEEEGKAEEEDEREEVIWFKPGISHCPMENGQPVSSWSPKRQKMTSRQFLQGPIFFLSQKKKKKEDNEAQPQPGSQAPIKADVKQIYSSTLPCFYVRLCFRGAHPSLRRLKWARFKRRPFFLP